MLFSMHPIYDSVKDVLTLIGAGCVLSMLAFVFFCLVAYSRKEQRGKDQAT